MELEPTFRREVASLRRAFDRDVPIDSGEFTLDHVIYSVTVEEVSVAAELDGWYVAVEVSAERPWRLTLYIPRSLLMLFGRPELVARHILDELKDAAAEAHASRTDCLYL